ncbi:hypothetical protein EYF80_010498 [Liparis tanakae]|uniref:Uncharacterized protein n=1 Tax=Liparis tanakae TaxID=230148 RepID=A0A4Z2IQ06_9TELE|nr:hypothetical protein EYF80_010498 [Liparis tanakae]
MNVPSFKCGIIRRVKKPGGLRAHSRLSGISLCDHLRLGGNLPFKKAQSNDGKKSRQDGALAKDLVVISEEATSRRGGAERKQIWLTIYVRTNFLSHEDLMETRRGLIYIPACRGGPSAL